LEKSPDNEESVYQMRRERTEAARIAKKVKAAKKNWTGIKRTSRIASTLPSLDKLRNGRMTALDMTLDQQFVRRDSDSESENEATFDPSLISIPVPQDLLGKFGAASNS
jgi:predicted NAD/FAD-dependent oxidoreductase